MVAFTRSFFSGLILTALLAIYVDAVPWPVYKRHGTHRLRTIGKRGLTISTYHPKNTFKTHSASDAPSVTSNSLTKATLGDTAKSFMSSSLGIDAGGVVYKSGFTYGSTSVAFVKQSTNGIPLANSVANIAFNGSKILSYGSSFAGTKSAKGAPSGPPVGWKSVLPSIEDTFGCQIQRLQRHSGVAN